MMWKIIDGTPRETHGGWSANARKCMSVPT
jgi:hypothetical protein